MGRENRRSPAAPNRNPSLAIWVLVTALSGCTLEDGAGFGHLSGKLWSHFAGLDKSAGRLTADGWFKTSDSFEFKIEAMSITPREILVKGPAAASSASQASCTFDPANPPAGCSLCHGGHCHCGGELKTYEALKAIACGAGASGATTLAALSVKKAQNLLAGGARANLSRCTPSCELDQGAVSQVAVALDRLSLKASLRDRTLADRLGGQQPAVQVDLDLAGAVMAADLTPSEKIDRDSPYYLDLAVAIPVNERLLDGVAWDKLSSSAGVIDVSTTSNSSAAALLVTNLAQTKLVVIVQRQE